MAIWTLEADIGFTPFYFPLEEDKLFFEEFAKNYLEESKSGLEKWRPLFMLRGEPMKHPDFFTIDGTDAIAISEKAVNSLKDFLKDMIELLPIETDAGRYYTLNVLNFVDCLNKVESEFESTKNGRIVSYSLLEFDEEKLGDNEIFRIPEMPYHVFITDVFQELCDRNFLEGLFFDIDSNLVWYAE